VERLELGSHVRNEGESQRRHPRDAPHRPSSHMSARERQRRLIDTNDPTALVEWGRALRSVVERFRTLVQDATSRPVDRVHGRLYLRGVVLKDIRELENRLDAMAPSAVQMPAG
jgi:hypothetical protein